VQPGLGITDGLSETDPGVRERIRARSAYHLRSRNLALELDLLGMPTKLQP